MQIEYPAGMTLREARKRYFEANAFGADGGYGDAWVHFKFGPIPFPFPNSKSRVRAVRYHDLHHVLTGFDTDLVGEFEISAWEIAAGCKSFPAAWVLNLGGIAGGLWRSPRRTFMAFVRGRQQSTLYGEDLEAILDGTVSDIRARFAPEPKRERPHAGDVAWFVVAAAVGVVVGTFTFAIVVPLVPFGLVAHVLQRRESRARV